jgi:hypothetical protein
MKKLNAALSEAHIGFQYKFLHFDVNGKLIEESPVELNLIPEAGMQYLIGTGLRGSSGFSNWYIGLYEGNYAPQSDDTMANFPGDATEITTAYSNSTRPALTPDDLDAGRYVNSDSPAVFTFTSEKTVRGAFICSNSVKGNTTGTLLSAVLAASPKTVGAGESLKVITGLNLTST